MCTDWWLNFTDVYMENKNMWKLNLKRTCKESKITAMFCSCKKWICLDRCSYVTHFFFTTFSMTYVDKNESQIPIDWVFYWLSNVKKTLSPGGKTVTLWCTSIIVVFWRFTLKIATRHAKVFYCLNACCGSSSKY